MDELIRFVLFVRIYTDIHWVHSFLIIVLANLFAIKSNALRYNESNKKFPYNHYMIAEVHWQWDLLCEQVSKRKFLWYDLFLLNV